MTDLVNDAAVNRFLGTVLFFNRLSRFGFIVPDSEDIDNIFFSCIEINMPDVMPPASRRLRKAQRVTFSIGPNPHRPGNVMACEITPLGESTPIPVAPTLNAADSNEGGNR